MDISKISCKEIAEICREYERAESRSKQIQISSELHLLSKNTIKEILESQGYILPQVKKRANTVTILHNGKNLTIYQWAKETGIPTETIRHRYYRGWAPEAIFSTPLKQTKPHKAKGDNT